MSKRTDYSEDEWSILLRAPALAGLAVVAAAPSGPIGVFKELQTMGKWILDAGKTAPAGSLLSDLVADIRAIAERKIPAPAEEKIPPDQFRTKVQETLRRGVSILSSRATASDAEAWKNWVLDTAANIAKAAKEGTVLGFGGTLVSDAERTALRDIADALGLVAPAV